MASTAASKPIVLGFLSIIDGERGMLQGGYLLTTEHGRPIEFHYTAPMSLDRQERALYGAQFEPYFHAEVIGKPLTDKQGTAPRIVLVNRASLLELRPRIPAPVVLLSKPLTLEAPPTAASHQEFPQDLQAFEKVRSLVSARFDWMEPFSRISEALAEIGEVSIVAA